jgi:hypothetical protein
MKKRLEAELISIAHRVLKLKNKSEVDQLYLETKKLHETITVLKFYNDNFELVKNSVSQKELDEKLAISFDEKKIEAEIPVPVTAVEEEKIEIVEEEKIVEAVAKEEITPEIIVAVEEKIEISEVETKEEIAPEVVTEEVIPEEKITEIQPEIIEEAISKPDFELTFDSKINEDKKPKANEIIFDDFLGPNYADPVFVKPEDLAIEKEIEQKEKEKTEEKVISADKNTKGITIGLNDRVAFMKHLFANSSEDYNRVLSQLITFDTYQEAQTFIAEMVKPDYNDWKGKEDYETRFMEIVEKKFS